MTNRELTYLVRDQKPLMLPAGALVREACQAMWRRRIGCVLVVDDDLGLAGIFTGRDAVRQLAKGKDPGSTPLSRAMTRAPAAIAPRSRSVDALKAMGDGGFRHLPVVEHGRVRGVISRGDFKGMEFEAYRWREAGRAGSAANRALAEIVSRQKPLVLRLDGTVADAAKAMWKRKAGSVVVTDKRGRVQGIFTGRDAVRVLGRTKDAAKVRLAKAMTADPASLPPEAHAIDALRTMNDGGFRHVPVVGEDGRLLGVVSRSDFTGVELDRLEEEEHLKECIW